MKSINHHSKLKDISCIPSLASLAGKLLVPMVACEPTELKMIK